MKMSTHLLDPKSCILSIQFFHVVLKLVNSNLYYYYIVLYSTVLHYIVLYCIALYCILFY